MGCEKAREERFPRALTTILVFIVAFLSGAYGYLGASSRVTIERLERTPNTKNIECQIIYWNTASSMAQGRLELICGKRAAEGKCAPSTGPCTEPHRCAQ